MSTCKTCGVEILWVRKDEGWLPPFDMPENLPAVTYTLFWNNVSDSWEVFGKEADAVNPEHMVLTPHKHRKPMPAEMLREMGKSDRMPLPQDIQRTAEDPRADHAGEVQDVGSLRRLYEDARDEIERLNRKMNDHGRLLEIADRLSGECPKCIAPPFQWCTYMARPDTETLQLHRERV